MTTTMGTRRLGQRAQVCLHFCIFLINVDMTGSKREGTTLPFHCTYPTASYAYTAHDDDNRYVQTGTAGTGVPAFLFFLN